MEALNKLRLTRFSTSRHEHLSKLAAQLKKSSGGGGAAQSEPLTDLTDGNKVRVRPPYGASACGLGTRERVAPRKYPRRRPSHPGRADFLIVCLSEMRLGGCRVRRAGRAGYRGLTCGVDCGFFPIPTLWYIQFHIP